MEGLKPHPRLVTLHERFGDRTSAITLRGFVGPSAEGVVRLYPTPNVGEYMEIPETAIVHFEQSDVSDTTQLFVEPSAIVTLVSVRAVPLIASALRPVGTQQPGGTTCLEKRIDSCKRDPTIQNKAYCDSDEAKRMFRFFCDVIGNPPNTPTQAYSCRQSR